MEILTPRLRIREIQEQDKYYYWTIWMQFLCLDSLYENENIEIKSQLADAHYKKLQSKSAEVYSILDKQTDEYIGMIDVYPTDEDVPELGIILDDQFQNVGIGKESSIAFCNWLFFSRNMDHIEVSIKEDNTKSRHLFENLGAEFHNKDEYNTMHYTLSFPL